VSGVSTVRSLAASAAASLEASRARIDDLNVYPVPDGDTGTNMSLTMRALVEALDGADDTSRAALAHTVTRATLMGARGNSGVILSQIVRGAAEVLGSADEIDAATVAAALRSACDAAYRGVRTPVEGTILTVARELAEEAEARASAGATLEELLRAVLERGEEALARTPDMLDVLRDAGVVDAGGAGLVELMRGVVAGITGDELPSPAPVAALGIEAIHQELTQFRYCTAFLVEGVGLDVKALETELEPLGDSLLVVGDASALKVHVHTDDPGAALSLATARGALAGVEIADMHVQTARREQRLVERDNGSERPELSAVVAIAAGTGNCDLYASLGAAAIVEGGQSMNPSTADILDAVEGLDAREAVVLPNNGNVIMSAEQAATLATKPVVVVPTRSIQAGLAALLVHDPARSAAENAAAMREALASVATASVTTASRDVELNGLRVTEGQYLGLVEDEPVVGGDGFDEVATAVVDTLLVSPHDMLTLLTGAEAPPVETLLTLVEERYPELEIDVQPGGQPHYHLLISAE
jgi:DAK2 domain fusion protein YloV